MKSHHLAAYLLALTLFSEQLVITANGEPQWIWTQKRSQVADEAADFRITFNSPEGAPIKSAKLRAAADNRTKIRLNGERVLKNDEWAEAASADVTAKIKAGPNELIAWAQNEGLGAAGLLVQLTIVQTDGKQTVIESGPEWQWSSPNTTSWQPVAVVGKLGGEPWGNPLAGGGGKSSSSATEAKDIQVLPGFAVERLYVVPKGDQGSWVAMTTEPSGALICGDQYGGLYRVKPGAPGQGEAGTQVQPLKTNIGGAHGLLYAFDSLYLINNERTNSASKAGLWRLQDKDKDGEYETEQFLRALPGGGEHGPHSIILSPDGKSLYICCGNHTKPPELNAWRGAKAWQEDHLLPRMWDARGHAQGIMAPGGYIVSCDPEAQRVEMFCHGFRNEFDIAFNHEGELFTYDSDMEWDIGAPWYRPTRVIHCVSGADYGWRSGSGKWPETYVDSLPATIDIGPGSPTGVTFGVGAKFPVKYQRALYAADWTYGTLYAIHLTDKGGSYTAEKEEFLSGKPLPLTDVMVHPQDGALYFAIGGRKTQSALYRVTHAQPEPPYKTQVTPASGAATAEKALRRQLESLHDSAAEQKVIDTAWPHLSHPDRFIRTAARIAIERQPVQTWTDVLWSEKTPLTIIEGCVALARTALTGEVQGQLVDKLNTVDMAQLDVPRQLALLRAYQLAFTRLSDQSRPAVKDAARKRIEPFYPSKNNALDRELAQLLIWLDSPRAVATTLSLMATAADPEATVISGQQLLDRNSGYATAFAAARDSRPNKQQMALAWSLRAAKTGWTPELRKNYFAWFPTTKKWKGGNSFAGFIENARKEALDLVPPGAEREALDVLSTTEVAAVATSVTPPKGPGKAYTIEDVLQLVGEGNASLKKGRNFTSGKNLFAATACSACHRFAGEGSGVGPDITGIGNRYSLRDLMENIIEPSKVISDQYESTQIETKSGIPVVGRIVKEDAQTLQVAMNPLDTTQLTPVPVSDVTARKPYPISLMPPGLINSLNENELKDLLAYLMSGGNADDPAFK